MMLCSIVLSFVHMCLGVLPFRLAEVRMCPVVPMWQCPMALARKWPGLQRKGKAVTGAPTYPFVWALFGPTVSCVVIFLRLFAALVLL